MKEYIQSHWILNILLLKIQQMIDLESLEIMPSWVANVVSESCLL